MSNQASEDERTKLALILGYEMQEQHSSEKTRWYDLDEYGNPIEVTKKVDKVIELIRTEKLKAQTDILQEGISESKEFCGEDVDINLGWVNFKLNELRQSLAKLEAEL